MLRFFLRLSFATVVLCGTASAGGYDDYTVGMNAANRGDGKTAIDAFTKALADADLPASLKSAAYYRRGIAYLHEKNCAATIADESAVLAATPRDVEALAVRATAYKCEDKLVDALRDDDAAIAISPAAGLYAERGRLRWQSGDFANSASDFEAALKLQPEAPYVALWLAVSRMRQGSFDAQAFDDSASDVSYRDWPGPIVKFYLGRKKLADIYAEAASSGDAQEQAGRKCEADFYIGEWQLSQKDVANAQASLKSAADNCPARFIEAEAAKLELQRMK